MPDEIFNLLVIMTGCLFWGLIGLIAGSQKNYKVEGFWFGALLWIFGIIIIVAKDGNKVRCPFCKELIFKEATYCPHCTQPIPANCNKNGCSSMATHVDSKYDLFSKEKQ